MTTSKLSFLFVGAMPYSHGNYPTVRQRIRPVKVNLSWLFTANPTFPVEPAEVVVSPSPRGHLVLVVSAVTEVVTDNPAGCFDEPNLHEGVHLR